MKTVTCPEIQKLIGIQRTTFGTSIVEILTAHHFADQ